MWQSHDLNAFWLHMSWGELIWSHDFKCCLNSDDSQICISSPDFSPELQTCISSCCCLLLPVLPLPRLSPSPSCSPFPFFSFSFSFLSTLMVSQTWFHNKEDPCCPYPIPVSLKVFSILANGIISQSFAQEKSWNNTQFLSFSSLTLKLSRTPWGSLSWKPFCVPHFFFIAKRLQPPWPSLSSKGQIWTVGNQRGEGMQRQGESSQETVVQPPGRVLVLPQGIHVTISLSSLQN